MPTLHRLYSGSPAARRVALPALLLAASACFAQQAQPAHPPQQMTPVSRGAAAPTRIGPPPAAQTVQSTPAPARRPMAAQSNRLAAAPASQPARVNPGGAGSAAVAIKLARAIESYALRDFPRATEQFEAVLQISPQEPGALWYLGLLKLDAGLEARRAAESAPDPGARAQLLDEGERAFEQARDYLESLLRLDSATPSVQQVRPIEAGLVLAIARLAENDEDRFRQLTSQAISTLETYDQQTQGKDYLAKFFLGIAHWRLGLYEERDLATQQAEKQLAAQYFDETERLIGRVAPPTSAPSGEGAQHAIELTAIRLYVMYYRGIQALDAEDRARGIEMLRQVEEEAAAIPDLYQLRIDAGLLVQKAQETATGGPRPISFFSRPFGPIEFRANLQLGMGYDSNAILLGDDTALPRRIVKQDDWFANTDSSFELTRRFTKTEDNFGLGESLTLGISGDMSHRWHPSIREFDLNQYRGRAFLAWEPVTDIFAYFEYLYSYTMLGHKPFISSNGGFVGLTKRWSDAARGSFGTRSDIYYGYEWRNYLDELFDFRLDRDGAYQLIGLRQSFDLWRADELWPDYYANAPEREKNDARRFANVFFGYEFREERTQGKEFDLGGHSALAGIEVPLPWRLSAGYQVRLNWDNYSARSLFDFTGDERFDFRQVHGVVLTYIILGRGEKKDFESLEIRLRGFAELVFQDSNVTDARSQDVYSYDRGQYGLALQISF